MPISGFFLLRKAFIISCLVFSAAATQATAQSTTSSTTSSAESMRQYQDPSEGAMMVEGGPSVSRIPSNSRRGIVDFVVSPHMTVDGNDFELAPPGTIRGRTNLIERPASIAPGTILYYVLNEGGQISSAWIPTEQEDEASSPSLWSLTKRLFQQ